MLEFNKRSFRFNVPFVSGSIKFTEPPEPEIEFIDIVDLLKTLDSTDKVALVLRHSERDDISGSHELTLAGRTYAFGLGQRMLRFIRENSQISLYSSTAQRCQDTAQLISDGIRCTNQINTDELISSCPYQITAPSSGWEDYSLYAYDLPTQHGAVFKDKATITTQLLEFFKARMDTRLNLFITHDQLLEILVVDVMNKNIDLRFFNGSGRWITYLAGLAIVEHQNGTYEYFPVKGLDRGWQPGYSNVYIPDSVTIGGRSYPTTIIGNQILTTENLDYEFSGCIINPASVMTQDAAAFYETEELRMEYGLMYNWFAAKYLDDNKETLLPQDWHIPSKDDFNTLIAACGEDSGKKLKSKNGWNDDGNGTDDFRFCALPAGLFERSTQKLIGKRMPIWSSTFYIGIQAYHLSLDYDSDDATVTGYLDEYFGFSIRPMKTLKHYQ